MDGPETLPVPNGPLTLPNVYKKSGLMNGQKVTFEIDRSRVGREWSWGICFKVGEKRCCKYTQWTVNEMPSETGWVRYHCLEGEECYLL